MPRRLALVVGASSYSTKTQLKSLTAPANDAQAVYEVLAHYGGFDMLYTLPLGNGRVGTSGEVKAKELHRLLEEVLKPQADVELVLVYFSGHGVYEDGKGGFLCCSDDKNAVTFSWLVQQIQKCSASVCLLLDCCHSGGVLDFIELKQQGLCIVAASSVQGEALAAAGKSLLTQQLCQALIPDARQSSVTMRDLIQRLKQSRHNLPQQVLLQHSGADVALTAFEPNPHAFGEIPLWASATGVDEYGRYADLQFKEVVQRFRWITQVEGGFWLADTACTQAFWLAVVGKNPAHFKGDLQRPIEQVSWYAVQRFCEVLKQQVQGLQARLPSTNEWEWACRAEGVLTELHPSKAQATQAVKALPPNAWGLYQMLGNVWEWCADDLEVNDEARPLRGGCWASAKTLTCAASGKSAAGNSDYTIGFRLAI